MWRVMIAGVAVAASMVFAAPGWAQAPGAPGAVANWTAGDKTGFGTARGLDSSLPVVDRELGVDTPNGRFWHRYNYDGYGETLAGGPFPGDGNRGRLWPIFAGERGEYELLAGDERAARGRVRSIATTANSGQLLPEQVWDEHPPPGHEPGTGTFSATPLGWTHAQLVRLAWSIDAGHPVERPAVVACRYTGACG